ncbi:MAG: ribonuclease H-like domain-containing protein [Patescibacteria group bacterium]|nr:ribonuclease H-like domain-containing protein [Patescibacteria group bacterium]
MRKITLDIETSNIGSSMSDPSQLDLALVGIHDSQNDEYVSFTLEDIARLWPILESADIVIGYNSDHFDIPILNKYYPGNLSAIRSVDLMKEIKKVLGRRLRLDNVAEATLGRKKSGSGLQAVKWWAQGEREKVRAYCLEDVRITRELYDWVRKNGSLKYRDFDGIRELKIDTKEWEKPTNGSLTHTLPF